MKIQAEGKFINSFPLSFFLTQGEQNADTVEFEVAREYDGVDLSGCTFVLTAVNADGTQLEATLTKTVAAETITLAWQVNGYFTAVAGLLTLELRAVQASEDAVAGEYDEAALVLKYVLAPVFVREPASGTAGELPTPELITQALDQLAITLEAALDAISAQATTLGLDNLAQRLNTMEGHVLAESRMTALTQVEYDALTSYESERLYVILPAAEEVAS